MFFEFAVFAPSRGLRKETRMPVTRVGSFSVDHIDAGSGPAVVLLHSSAGGNRQWRQLIEGLQARCRVLAVNLFGYGETSRWPGTRPLTAADQAELVAGVVASVPGPVALVGHSMGAVVAFEAAGRLSKRVSALIAFEPIFFADLKAHGPAEAFEEINGVAMQFNRLAAREDWDAVGNLFIDYWAAPGAWQAMPDKSKQYTRAMLPPVLHEWEMVMSGVRPLEDWKTIAAPVHLIHARDTRAPTRAISNLLGKTYPHWRLHEVPSGGHMAPLARPDLVNPLIETVIDRQTAQTASA
jgi:pimeloyl-ACP methyl ester carboxylesterase